MFLQMFQQFTSMCARRTRKQGDSLEASTAADVLPGRFLHSLGNHAEQDSDVDDARDAPVDATTSPSATLKIKNSHDKSRGPQHQHHGSHQHLANSTGEGWEPMHSSLSFILLNFSCKFMH
jgi:hypothetical protein